MGLREWLSWCCAFRIPLTFPFLWWPHDGSVLWVEWPTIPVAWDCRGFPGHGTFSAKIIKVPGKPGWVGYPTAELQAWGARGFPALICHAMSCACSVTCRAPKAGHTQKAGWRPWFWQRVGSQLLLLWEWEPMWTPEGPVCLGPKPGWRQCGYRQPRAEGNRLEKSSRVQAQGIFSLLSPWHWASHFSWA